MKKPTKYVYEYIIQSLYDYWEDVSFEDTFLSGKMTLRDYRVNQPEILHRLIKRRTLRQTGTQ